MSDVRIAAHSTDIWSLSNAGGETAAHGVDIWDFAREELEVSAHGVDVWYFDPLPPPPRTISVDIT